MKKNYKILAIESSCDDTSAAVVCDGRIVLSNVVSSQIDIHTRFGGVVPEIASRNHILAIQNIVKEALRLANVELKDIDAIAVTYGSGLLGSLLVGVSFAKALSFATGIPLMAVNHIEGHIASNYITHQKLSPPFVCLLVSGGHTALLTVPEYNKHILLADTLDDAVGEAFDKVARVLGLGYPGGPQIQKKAKSGTANIKFLHNPNNNNMGLNFSFSGKKTAVINYIHKIKQNNEEIRVDDISASFQYLVVNELVDKSIQACVQENIKKLVIAGGVSANEFLRETLDKAAADNGISVFYPELKFCMDNAAMIGAAAYYMIEDGREFAGLTLTPNATIPL